MDMNDVGGMFSSALGAVGNVLDAPRSMVYSGLINPAYHALGGDPTRQIGHASDLLEAAGMDKDSMLTKGLGVAGDMATDPLTYAGGFAGEGLARLGLRGLGTADEALTAGRGVSNLAEGAGMKSALGDVTKFKDVMPAAGGAGGDILADGFSRAGENAGLIASEAGSGYTGRVVGGQRYMPGQIEGKFDGVAQRLADNPDMAAAYSPDLNATITRAGASPRVIRHENVHALIDQAAKNGTADQLPSSLMSIPAKLQAYGGGHESLAGGFGAIGDELAGQTLENRGTMEQLKGGANYLFNPQVNGAYSALYGRQGMNPTALAAYRAMRYAPAAAGAAVGGSAGMLGQALGQ